MRLQRLKKNDPKTVEIYQAARKLIESGAWSIFGTPVQINLIKTQSLRTDVKPGNWGTAMIVCGTTDSGKSLSSKLFVKRTSKSQFDNELAAQNQLTNAGMSASTVISLPLYFDRESSLIASSFVTGDNAKWLLRHSLLRPWQPRLRESIMNRFEKYGHWLAAFHQSNIVPGNASSDWMNTLFYSSAEPCLDSIGFPQMQEELRALVVENKFDAPVCLVHGDFGPQNILDDGESFAVIDWEHFHYAAGIVDCIHFSINTLTQARHIPILSSTLEGILDSFLLAYCKDTGQSEKFVALVKLVSISNIFKRQEWTGKPFSPLERWFFVNTLKHLANRCYKQL